MYSVLIKQALVLDGSGSPAKKLDVAFNGNTIAAVSPNITTDADKIIDGSEYVLTPGFIDIQNHSDSYWQLFDNPSLDSILTQGFTTIVVGNSGASLAPLLSREALLSLQKWHSLDGVNINWQSYTDFARYMQQQRFGTNVASLVGYSTLRRGLVGDRTTALATDELEALKQSFKDAVTAGAWGISAGLSYAHEVSISEIELYEIAKVSKETNTLFSLHLRDEAGQIIESIREAVALAEQSGGNIKIAHLHIRNQANWDKRDAVIAELEVAWHRGINIHFDVYPYTSIWQPLYSYLPKWAIEGGRKHVTALLQNPGERAKLLTHLHNSGVQLAELLIAGTTTSLHVAGKRLGQIAADMGTSSEEALLTLVEHGGSEVLVFDDCLESETVRMLTEHPLGLVSSNGGGFPLRVQEELVHPRSFGTSQTYLAQVLADKRISLAEAVRKLTSSPAKVLGLENRGTIAPGFIADVTLLRTSALGSKATLTNPFQVGSGIEYVFIGGKAVMEQGHIVDTKQGQFLVKTP